MPAGRSLFVLLVLSLTSASAASVRAAAPATQEELYRVADAFYGATALDDSSARSVQNVTIAKDYATFTLKSGTLYLTKPLEGMVVSAVFMGEGLASIAPTRPMDKLCMN